jgi:hypothetical protein
MRMAMRTVGMMVVAEKGILVLVERHTISTSNNPISYEMAIRHQ